MLCPKCNTEIAEGSKFCGNCGEAIEGKKENISEAGIAVKNEIVQVLKAINQKIAILLFILLSVFAFAVWNCCYYDPNVRTFNCSVDGSDKYVKASTMKMTKIGSNSVLVELERSYLTEETVAFRNGLKWALDKQKGYSSPGYTPIGDGLFEVSSKLICYVGKGKGTSSYKFYLNSEQAAAVKSFLEKGYKQR